MPSKNKKKNVLIPITVHTMEAELKFNIQETSTGQDLFDMVCRTVGLREHWYFDLEYHGASDLRFWLKRNKKVVDQCSIAGGGSDIQCWFIVKFYPEDVSEELIQEITQHLFFLQVKQCIVNMYIYCQPEVAVLLASYAAQAQHGDYDERQFGPGSLNVGELLPQNVIDQYQLTPEMWEERIHRWYADHKPLSREESEKEFLKIAQEQLVQFGFSYFPIKLNNETAVSKLPDEMNKRNTQVVLGVNSLGLHIFQTDNKLQPVVTFPWREIRDIEHTDKKFRVKTLDNSHSDELTFSSRNLQTNNLLFELCEGNHRLYKTRRLPDTLEVQQMKAQAREEREKKQMERARLNKEFEMRALLQSEKEELEQRCSQLQQENELVKEALRRSDETAELLSQKADIFESENQLLREKAGEAESEIRRIQNTAQKTEDERLIVEKRARDAEILASKILEDSEQRAREMEVLKQELERSRQAEQLAKTKLAAITSDSLAMYGDYNGDSTGMDDELLNADVSQLQAAIDQEKSRFEEKSKTIHAQLASLKSDMDQLKVEDHQSQLDRLHEEGVQRGDNKFRTLQKTTAGSTKTRLAFFEEL